MKAVCKRELGIELDKGEQVSDWRRRPLTRRQVAYAAMDVETLLDLRRALLKEGPPGLRCGCATRNEQGAKDHSHVVSVKPACCLR